MKKQLEELAERMSEEDSRRFDKSFSDFGRDARLSREKKERISSSVMRKAGFEMNETITMRRTDKEDNTEKTAEYSEVSRSWKGAAAAACLVLALAGTLAAVLMFGGKSIEIDEPKTQLTEQTTASAADPEQRRVQDWAAGYLEQNPETVGHLKIAGIRKNGDLDYPVVQHSYNEYYLNHGFDNSESPEGAIYADCRLTIDEKGQPGTIVLYGNNMCEDLDDDDNTGEDSMFTSLLNYKNSQSFCMEHSIIDFSTVYDRQDTKYQIFACFSMTSDEMRKSFDYLRYRDMDEGLSFDDWLTSIKKHSTYWSDILCTEKDAYLMLTTEYSEDGVDNLFVIVARKLDSNSDVKPVPDVTGMSEGEYDDAGTVVTTTVTADLPE